MGMGDDGYRWPTLQTLLHAIAAHRRRRRWPWWLAAVLAAVGLISAIAWLVWPARVAPPEFPVVPLTHRGDLKIAAISPGGDELAFVAGDSLVIRRSELGAADRTVIEHGIAAPIAWSPDGKHLLAGTAHEIATLTETALVDIDQGVQFKLPVPGRASFLSSTEIAVTSPRRRSVTILPAAAHATAIAACDVPGDYTFLVNVIGLPDGTMVVETSEGGIHALVILERDCRVRATFSAEPISSAAATDTGTLVALVARDGFDEILEISLDGTIVSRRRVSGELGRVLGRRHGIDYVTTRARGLFAQTALSAPRARV